LINSESKLVIVVATVVILHEDKTTVMASIKASCVFEVPISMSLFQKIPGRLYFLRVQSSHSIP